MEACLQEVRARRLVPIRRRAELDLAAVYGEEGRLERSEAALDTAEATLGQLADTIEDQDLRDSFLAPGGGQRI